MAYQAGPNDLLRAARRARLSPSGSGRPMSRQELAEAVAAYLFEQAGRSFGINAKHIAAFERGRHRWPSAHYRTALRAVLGAATDAELGFFIIRGHATDAHDTPDQPAETPAASQASEAAGPAGPTLLRVLLVERHWQVYRTFRALFLRAARQLADRENDPTSALLDVSARQFHRWQHGARPRPDACRVLESMFGHPVDRLIGPADPPTADVAAAVTEARGADPAPVVRPAAVQVSVSAEPGTAVTVVCPDDGAGRVAVLAGGVQVVIDACGRDAVSLVPAVPDVPATGDGVAVAGGARVYSLAARRGQR